MFVSPLGMYEFYFLWDFLGVILETKDFHSLLKQESNIEIKK
jgi:hypothetical protein